MADGARALARRLRARERAVIAMALCHSKSRLDSPTTPWARSPRRSDSFADVDRANVMIKIPATKEGLPAIRAVLGAGINVNVTLIFSLERYDEVISAWRGSRRRRRASDTTSAHRERGVVLRLSRRRRRRRTATRGRPPSRHHGQRAGGGGLRALPPSARASEDVTDPLRRAALRSSDRCGRRLRRRIPRTTTCST